MGDVAWTANTLICTSGTLVIKIAGETIEEGDWLYEVTAGSPATVGVATNDDSDKDTVIGQAMTAGVTGKPIVMAPPNAVIEATATPAVATADWYVLSADGATSPVADQTTNDQVVAVARGTAAGEYIINIINTGLVAP